jgi:hypothetical protein
MPEPSQPMSATVSSTGASTGCPLPVREQSRNVLVYAGCMGLIYLAAPVLYVGITQASLCDALDASTTLANLPGTAYFLMTFMPVLIAWYWPFVSVLRRNVVLCFVATAVASALVAVVLPLRIPDSWRLEVPWPQASSADWSWGSLALRGNDWKVAIVVLHAAVCGITSPTAVGLLWEMIGRGVNDDRRGQTLGLAFGVGPLLAVAGSFIQTLLLGGGFFGIDFRGIAYPWGFVALFGMAAPIMLAAALLASRCIVPLPAVELRRQPFWQGTFGGLGKYLGDRLLLTATIVTMLIYTGNTIGANMNLFAPEVLGDTPARFAGMQNMLRFSFKFVAGLSLGWLLTRSNPRAGVLTTGGLFVAAMVWGIFASGHWYLVAFGLYGAGELVGVYAPNFILSASPRSDYRRNMAFVQMIMVPTAPAGALFGWIAEHYGAIHGHAAGFRISFAVCALLMLCGILLAIVALPARPRPRE